MIIADISFDLRVLIPGLLETADESIAEIARSRLKNTLDNFTDPYAGKINQQGASLLPESLESQANGISVDFTFGVTAWRGALNTPVVSDVRAFGLQNLEALEHVVDGWVDAAGVFHGKIKAFGKWLDGEILIQPEAPIKARSDSRVGAFGIRLATFEQQLKSSTHDAGAHSFLSDRANQNAGFFIFRNGLRIMPYGREDNDFFEIEYRRGMHAGREFWSIRRIFGRVALTIEENPNLKDKAGREGFIDNKAAKVFREIGRAHV